MAEWSFLTNHARALVCIADDPGVRLRDIAAALGITERTAFGIVTDLGEAGYVVKDKEGRRNRYRIQEHLPLPEAVGRERTIGEVLGLLIDTRAPESAQPPDRNAASDRPTSTRAKPSPRRDRKSAPQSERRRPRIRGQQARDEREHVKVSDTVGMLVPARRREHPDLTVWLGRCACRFGHHAQLLH